MTTPDRPQPAGSGSVPETDVHAFAVEPIDTLRTADHAAITQLLTAWQHTAEVYSDPVLLAA
ncbi:hypothetical protein [Streptomyces amritsarensis]|uniref:hypothetical protein n=1 Tax=Streptomyces amritsarensis TaxID=681158 RepID=UPI0036C6298B